MVLFSVISGMADGNMLQVEVIETSAAGNKLTPIPAIEPKEHASLIVLDTSKVFQTITGFGGAFTQSTASVLNSVSKQNRQRVLEAYFGKEGANYSLARTHMGSCDFSSGHYTYAPVEEDTNLDHFSIQVDFEDLIPLIRDAMAVSEEGFRIIASPWTAPPWMKDNNEWVDGALLPRYQKTWADFYVHYAKAYHAQGISIWGFTVVNEPNGNGGNWESMLFSPEEMTDFVANHLGPGLEKHGLSDIVILGYDQNRASLREWVEVMFKDEASAKYFNGTAIHWYDSTYEVFPDALEYAHAKAPDKHLIQTEACMDAQIPQWKDDEWYWQTEATDWGFAWASPDEKYLHPKYAPVFRYARDIIGCLNHWVDGWIDWNMVLDRHGGPNWAKNWCGAPVLADTDEDEIYFTPLYYVMVHFSKYIRPGANVIAATCSDQDIKLTAAINPDNTISLVVLNETETKKDLRIGLGMRTSCVRISPRAIQTILIKI